MKKIYSLLFIFSFFTVSSRAQVALPYTLNFTTDDHPAWIDGVAQDGDGGTSNITNLDIEFFAAESDGVTPSGDSIMWKNNNYYFSGNPNFNGITPDGTVNSSVDGGVFAFVIKSTDGTDFSLNSFDAYDWGGSNWTMTAYKDGVSLGSINISFDHGSYVDKVIAQGSELPSYYNDIDEVRITPFESAHNGEMYPAINQIALGAASLPVSLYGFQGAYQPDDKNILLKWNTASEQNSDHFDIQRSNNSVSFITIASRKSDGNTSANHSYQYTDYNVLKQPGGELYYRLAEVDRDGKIQYSKIISVLVKNNFAITKIYPNPSHGQFNIVLPLTDGQTLMKVFDSAGRLIWQKIIKGNTYHLHLGKQSKGIYYIQLVQGNHHQSFSVVND